MTIFALNFRFQFCASAGAGSLYSALLAFGSLPVPKQYSTSTELQSTSGSSRAAAQSHRDNPRPPRARSLYFFNTEQPQAASVACIGGDRFFIGKKNEAIGKG